MKRFSCSGSLAAVAVVVPRLISPPSCRPEKNRHLYRLGRDDLKKTRPMDKIMYLIELLDDECNFYTCQAVVIRLRDMVCEWVS